MGPSNGGSIVVRRPWKIHHQLLSDSLILLNGGHLSPEKVTYGVQQGHFEEPDTILLVAALT